MTKTSYPVVSDNGLTTEEIDKVSSYLLQTRDVLAASVAGLSPSQWNFKAAPDRWSIAENIEHVIVVETRVQGMIGSMSDAPKVADELQQKEVDSFVLAEVPNRSRKFEAPVHVCPTGRWSGEEALALFFETREKTFQLVSAPGLRGHAMPHPVFGPWDGYQFLLGVAGHSARHAEQIREVKSEPGFPQASGATSAASD